MFFHACSLAHQYILYAGCLPIGSGVGVIVGAILLVVVEVVIEEVVVVKLVIEEVVVVELVVEEVVV